ncbi:MAG: hypothetical protein LBC90_07885 [Candidatus Adiutrix sp.]|jgi:hypothetical protein|nr:hypothetical protein [Candidatus Adiutrix sp.]
MATTIFLSPENASPLATQPDCDEARICLWFETSGSSPKCANRTSMACPKRLKDVFAPHYDRAQPAAK